MPEKPAAGHPEGADERRSGPEPGEIEEQGLEAAEEAAERVDEDLDELGRLQQERDEYLELAQRTRADFDNYRKRVASEAAAAAVRGKADLARELIPGIDNLERALRAAGIDPDANGAAPQDSPGREVSPDDPLARGVGLVYRELRSSLQRAGVEAYDPRGEKFDPSLHEALSTRPEDGAKSGVVVETLDRGYLLDGQVLRPARVIVSE
jgi:molecular chaperone GrpE